MGSRGLVSIVLAALFGCGPGNPNSGNDDSSKPTIDMKVSGGSDGTDGMTDGDSGKDGPTGTNRPPTVVLVDRDGLAIKDLKVRAGMDWVYQVRAEDPDGDDPLECKLKIKDQGAKSLYDSGWITCGSFRYNMIREGIYNLEAQAKDTKGMEGSVYNATAVAMKNVPPTVVLPTPDEKDPNDGFNVYNVKVGLDFCIGVSGDDLDGTVVSYKFSPDIVNNPGYFIQSKNPKDMCAYFESPGVYTSDITIIDNDGANASKKFYINVKN